MRFHTILLFLLLTSVLYSNAQNVEKEMHFSKQLNRYQKAIAEDILYVHTDKTIYTNNEDIWFSAYLVRSSRSTLSKHHFLRVLLVSEDSRERIISGKYLMENGLGFGSLHLPDTLMPGNYRLFYHTNLLGQDSLPKAVFEQPITIKSITASDFHVKLQVLDSTVSDERIRVCKPIIRCFPEGGALIAGLASEVGVEATSSYGEPISVRAQVLEDGKPIDTIETNSYGIGHFRLIPKIASRYTIKPLIDSDRKAGEVSFGFPKIGSDGAVVHLDRAVVKDTLSFHVYSPADRKMIVYLHDYHQGYTMFPLDAGPKGQIAKIILTEVPIGISCITVTDTLGRPLAERLFFAHYDRLIKGKIQGKDKASSREELTYQLQLSDQYGKPLKAVTSVAVVQSNRIETAKQKDILQCVYLEQELGKLPVDPQGHVQPSAIYLEDIMLVRGWRRYTWQDLVKAGDNDTLAVDIDPKFTGSVQYGGKVPKEEIGLSLLKKGEFKEIRTDGNGVFQLSAEDLLTTAERDPYLSVMSKRPEGYEVRLAKSPYVNSDLRLIRNLVPQRYPYRNERNSEDQKISGFEKTMQLHTVTINAQTDNQFYGTKPKGSNACGDYVDMAGRLNYYPTRNAAGNHPPVEGHEYYDATKGRRVSDGQVVDLRDLKEGEQFVGVKVRYEGCEISKPHSVRIPGIYMNREFYGVDRALDPSEPQYLSTLYWQPGLLTDKDGKITFRFLTGDIKGEYTITVQGIGIGNENLISAQRKIIVE